jgi:multidrug efflux system outer membrane protein
MAAEESNTRAVELAQERYKSGVGGFIDVLDSQRTLYDTQEELSAGKANALLAYVAIYRSLGGGWSESELSATPSK